jgi:UDP-N-acetylglucosamine diphosphorylase / glucose-1-phosphate thymidylyltransferase / UDP-N-acetylgalactosamine diphosphorylase / glucosamine-1-phosphate N-acetyltransferase / galactosamine-1-phosphate N-acetyltransferase
LRAEIVSPTTGHKRRRADVERTDRLLPQRAILLAAGRGARLGALTADRPKPMVPLLGKPVLEHILLRMDSVGLTDFVLVVGYKGDAIRAYFGDGARWSWRIAYAEQPVPNGTGAALAAARDLAGSGPILASYGDILTDAEHYRLLIGEFGRCACAAVVGINEMADVSAGSAVDRDGDRVVKVTEKPPPGAATSRWNLAGAGVYGPAIWSALAGLQPSPRGEYELTDAIEALIASGQEVRAREFNGFWSDIGTPEALAEAERALA